MTLWTVPPPTVPFTPITEVLSLVLGLHLWCFILLYPFGTLSCVLNRNVVSVWADCTSPSLSPTSLPQLSPVKSLCLPTPLCSSGEITQLGGNTHVCKPWPELYFGTLLLSSLAGTLDSPQTWQVLAFPQGAVSEGEGFARHREKLRVWWHWVCCSKEKCKGWSDLLSPETLLGWMLESMHHRAGHCLEKILKQDKLETKEREENNISNL